MRSLMTTKALCLTVFMGGVTLTFSGISAATASAASPLYWCPDQKADRQYSAKEGPGCVPLVEKKETPATEQEGETPTGDKPPRDFKIENQQGEEMGDEVGDLLKSTQANMSNHALASRGIMLREIIPTVSKALADLKKL